MVTLSYTSRRQAAEQSFPLPVVVLAPLLALFLQAFLTLRLTKLAWIDLPLLIVIYAALSRRSQLVGAAAGACIGLLQDLLTSLPLGLFGIAKTIVGYAAASISLRVDVDSAGARVVLVFVFTLLHDALVYVVQRFVLNMAHSFLPLHEILRASLNAVLGVFLYMLLDMFRRLQ